MKINSQTSLSSALILATAAAATTDPAQNFVQFLQSEENQALARDLVLIATGSMLIGKGIQVCVGQPEATIEWSRGNGRLEIQC